MIAVGLVLLVIAVLLVLAEAHLTTGGLIAGGAVVALVGGVIVLLIGAHAGVLAALVVATCVGAASVAALVVVARSFAAVARLRPRSGTEAMVGHVGVLRVDDTAARVFVDGALWRARPSPLDDDRPLHNGDRVVVERVRGLTVCVRRAEEWELEP